MAELITRLIKIEPSRWQHLTDASHANNNRTQHVCYSIGTLPTILREFRTRFHKLGSKGFTGWITPGSITRQTTNSLLPSQLEKLVPLLHKFLRVFLFVRTPTENAVCMIKPAMLSLDYNLKFMFASIDADNIAKLKIILRLLLSTYTIPSTVSFSLFIASQ